MDIGLRAPFVRKGPFACWALFASKSLGGQPRAYILFPSQIYPAKGFIGLDLVLWPANYGGAILRPTAGYSARERIRSIPRGHPLQRVRGGFTRRRGPQARL